ncbi:MAG: AMP-binding protein [bacterium]|nr:AMP-binding protein [Candidatus Kapabacteria bacterium]
MSANIIDIFLRNATKQPDAIAIVDDDNRTTYGELANDVQRAAGYLVSSGVERGDHVLVFVPMSTQLYTLLLALFHIGATAVFIDAWADRNRLARACRAIELKAFVGVPKAHLLRFVSKEIRRIPIKLIASVDGWRSTRSLSPETVAADHPALITFTTGSSGAPKGAIRTHGFLVAQHRALVASFETSRGDVDLPVLPIFALNNLAAGATTVIPSLDPRRVDEFDPAAIVAQMHGEGVSTTTGSPSFYWRLADHCVSQRVSIPSLRRIFLGGASVGPALARQLVAAFPQAAVTIVYGSTEAEPISMIDARVMLERLSMGGVGLPVGRPIRSIDVLILPIIDAPITASSKEELLSIALASNEHGEICVAGDHVLAAYHGDEQVWLRTKVRAGGRVWHRTGDAGYLDAHGELWLMGSVRQSFEHNGNRVFVLPIELMLATIDGVAAGTIMQIDKRIAIVVEATNAASHSDIEKRVRQSLDMVDIDDVHILEKIPRDPRHRSKINYEVLREMLVR